MNTEKTCPQCGSRFEGRSNQRYCSPRCKGAAFRESLTLVGDGRESPTAVGNPLSETALHLEEIRLQSAERLKKLELEEFDRQRQYEADQEERQYERELARASMEASRKEAELRQKSTALEEKVRSYESLMSKTGQHEPDADDEETERGSADVPGWVWVAGGLALLAWLGNRQNASTLMPQNNDKSGATPPTNRGQNGL